jgi:hypothetical protein
MLSKESWSQTRLMAYYTVCAFNGSKGIGTIDQFMPLPWDHKNKGDGIEVKPDEALIERLKTNIAIQNEVTRQKDKPKKKKY